MAKDPACPRSRWGFSLALFCCFVLHKQDACPHLSPLPGNLQSFSSCFLRAHILCFSGQGYFCPQPPLAPISTPSCSWVSRAAPWGPPQPSTRTASLDAQQEPVQTWKSLWAQGRASPICLLNSPFPANQPGPWASYETHYACILLSVNWKEF